MKKLFASFGWLLLLLPFISVASTSTLLTHIESHRFTTETRKVANFNAIASSGSFDVFVKMGSKEELRLEGDADFIKEIETKVENGVLKIRLKKRLENSWGFGNQSKVNIYITAKSLSGLSVSGSGDMEVDGVVKSTKVDVAVSGSGSITAKTLAKILNVAVSGSGEVEASGEAKTANVSISGSGEFEARKLRTGESNVKVSGSGEATVSADKVLNAAISGSGDIFYTGNPQVNSSKSGSGKITRI
ncbi:head GIN domain-containing protein [Pedobacter sp. SYSU D00535]|uniref:head GIN domain-containing protein n=1 Tax=Pedobacter sp. SYSU D00535 TaxID=2810308 RepID=UPI001A96215A|nr:head GIN domain-containing protein [Pedobacter sp. SYSU D00535]